MYCAIVRAKSNCRIDTICVETRNGPSGTKLQAETGKNFSIALPPPTIQGDLDAVQAVMAATSSNV